MREEQRYRRLELLGGHWRFCLSLAAASSCQRIREVNVRWQEARVGRIWPQPRFQFLIKLQLWAGCGATVATAGLRKPKVRIRLKRMCRVSETASERSNKSEEDTGAADASSHRHIAVEVCLLGATRLFQMSKRCAGELASVACEGDIGLWFELRRGGGLPPPHTSSQA